MTLVVLWMGALVTEWVRRELNWPWWVWLGYAAVAAWAIVLAMVRRQEQTMTLHALLDLRDRSRAEGAEKADPTFGGRPLFALVAAVGTLCLVGSASAERFATDLPHGRLQPSVLFGPTVVHVDARDPSVPLRPCPSGIAFPS
jgi:hypothetical protein